MGISALHGIAQVGMGRDHTLFALTDGFVRVSKKILPNKQEFVPLDMVAYSPCGAWGFILDYDAVPKIRANHIIRACYDFISIFHIQSTDLISICHSPIDLLNSLL